MWKSFITTDDLITYLCMLCCWNGKVLTWEIWERL